MRGMVVAIGIAVVVFCGCNPRSAPPAESDVTDRPTHLEPADASAGESLLAERRRLDQSVYAGETEAQTHEQFFVDLWDRMRGGSPIEALSEAAVPALWIGPMSPPSPLDLGVPGVWQMEATAGTPAEGDGPLTALEFRERLAELSGEGWVIDQSEWHHLQFEPGAEGRAARSVVSVELHAEHAGRETRVIIRGKLDVAWSRAAAEAAPVRPDEVRVRDLRILGRQGSPVFEPMLTFDPRDEAPDRFPRVHPILLHDMDHDGLSEILAVGCNVLCRNLGDGQFRFEDLCSHPRTLAESALIADLTGDGRVDLLGFDFDARMLILYEGDGGPGFSAPPRVAFDTSFRLPQVMTAGDIDGDGDLDLFIAQYKPPYLGGQMPDPYFDANDGDPSFLLINDGTGHFSDATESAGLGAKRHRRTYSASFVDWNGDRHLDLVVVSDFAGLDLYAGDGQGRFRDRTGAAVDQPRAFGMSHTFDDFDGDGVLDLFMIGMSSTTARRILAMDLDHPGHELHNAMRGPMAYGNRLYLSRDGRFVAAPEADTVARSGWSWGVTSADFDNDGDRDLYVANGNISGASARDYCTRFWRHDIFSGGEMHPRRQQLYLGEMRSLLDREMSWNGYEHNAHFLANTNPNPNPNPDTEADGNAGYENLGYLMGTAFEFDARSVVSDDLDGDGRMDLLVTWHRDRGARVNQVLYALRNRLEAEPSRHWIGFRLRQAPAGVSPIGAVVSIEFGGRRRVAQVVTGDSYAGQHAWTVHFGLGTATTVDRAEVWWPNGTVVSVKDAVVDRYHAVQSPAR